MCSNYPKSKRGGANGSGLFFELSNFFLFFLLGLTVIANLYPIGKLNPEPWNAGVPVPSRSPRWAGAVRQCFLVLGCLVRTLTLNWKYTLCVHHLVTRLVWQLWRGILSHKMPFLFSNVKPSFPWNKLKHFGTETWIIAWQSSCWV